MYASFFGFDKEPFSIAPDPRFLFMSERHREALAHLLYGVGGGGGFVLLTGEIGAGKTTVFRAFLEQLPPHCAVAYIFNPKLTALELLQTVCGEFGIAPPADAGSVKAHVDALNTFLLEGHARGRQALLVIDEAQALSADVLEQLRLLTNLETSERKLLQIVLIGQPELRDMLARPELEQLAQRVIARYHLGPLTLPETRQYVRHRLSIAAPNKPLPFDEAALTRIHALTGGVPRRINLLADRALLGAYAQQASRADRRTVERAAREVFGAAAEGPRRGGVPKAAVAAGVAGLVVLAAALAWALGRQAAPTVALAGAAAAGSAGAAGASAAGPDPARAGAALPRAADGMGTRTADGRGAGSGDGSAARGRAASEAAAPRPAADPAAVLAAAHAQLPTAWRELALRWNVSVGEGDPCQAVTQAQLACFRSSSGGLALVRQLQRPGIVGLRAPGGGTRFAVLSGVEGGRATLQAGSQTFELPLVQLAALWQGDFATLWRTPPGWRDDTDAEAARRWMAQQLPEVPTAASGADPTRAWRDRVLAYQLAEGLPADGRAGPVTLMRLNRSAGVDEPRLAEGAR